MQKLYKKKVQFLALCIEKGYQFRLVVVSERVRFNFWEDSPCTKLYRVPRRNRDFNLTKKVLEFPGKEWNGAECHGIKFRKFGYTSRDCHKVQENRNNQKNSFHSAIPTRVRLIRHAFDCVVLVYVENFWMERSSYGKPENTVLFSYFFFSKLQTRRFSWVESAHWHVLKFQP